MCSMFVSFRVGEMKTKMLLWTCMAEWSSLFASLSAPRLLAFTKKNSLVRILEMQMSCHFPHFVSHNNSERAANGPSPTEQLFFGIWQHFNLNSILFDIVSLVFVTGHRLSAEISFRFISPIVKWLAFYAHSLYYRLIKSLDSSRDNEKKQL